MSVFRRASAPLGWAAVSTSLFFLGVSPIGCSVDVELASPTLPAIPSANDSTGARFETAPAKIVPRDDDWVLEEDFYFVDSTGKLWKAPKGTVTDGASIPAVFLSLTGGPLDKAYRDAAVVHDAYCDSRNSAGESYQTESWRAVHRMFYEACVTAGTGPKQARAMYAAVWLGGPRWDDVSWRITALPEDAVLAEYQKCLDWMDENDPTLDQVEAWMDKRETALAQEHGTT